MNSRAPLEGLVGCWVKVDKFYNFDSLKNLKVSNFFNLLFKMQFKLQAIPSKYIFRWTTRSTHNYKIPMLGYNSEEAW